MNTHLDNGITRRDFLKSTAGVCIRIALPSVFLYSCQEESSPTRKVTPSPTRTTTPALTRTATPVETPDQKDLIWFSPQGELIDWHSEEPLLAYWINASENNGTALYLMFNNTAHPQTFTLPQGQWVARINTAKSCPEDIVDADSAVPVNGIQYEVSARSMAILSSTADSINP